MLCYLRLVSELAVALFRGGCPSQMSDYLMIHHYFNHYINHTERDAIYIFRNKPENHHDRTDRRLKNRNLAV